MTESKECRARAAQCIERANSSPNSAEQSIFFEMAKQWLQLAEAYEAEPSLRDLPERPV